MQQLSQYFVFNQQEIAGLIGLALLLIIGLYYYLAYYQKPLKYAEKRIDEDESTGIFINDYPKVSIIIESENEAQRLAANLPLILGQDYPNFEVVVVNKGSTDESDDVLQDLCIKHPNLYHTFIPTSYDRSLSTRKLALTVGIKAAKGDILLFTEAYSRPVSKDWIRLMVEGLMVGGKQIALGYSYYQKTNSFFNRLARFDNLFFSMQYMSMAIKNKPFIGIYRNIAFDRSLFFDNKGFASCLGLMGGEEVFIHRMLKEDNTVVVTEQDSFTETDIDSYSLWKQIKKSYSYARSNFDGMRSQIFKVEYVTRYLFYALFVAILAYAIPTANWGMLGIAISLFLIKGIVSLVVINKVSNYYLGGKFFLSFFLLELIQPLYNMKFRSRQKKHKH